MNNIDYNDDHDAVEHTTEQKSTTRDIENNTSTSYNMNTAHH